ncbi:hypothetical protein [Hymenobacter sp. BT491]|uniref:hypothetical protein n=1 Tax=Hymenobacter sp. BT491 TaxID=2766779 RepID=UPI001653A08D|nr:hypothetical protein [Hymenobacter sp. BT491]MBC6991015.1 hypothetical protein [Hymenobacter sp. BT491]
MSPSTPTVSAHDLALLALRPSLAELPAPANDTVGDFLHRTLRPVLKMQNELLLMAVADFVRDHHIPLATASPTDRERRLDELLTRNVKLRYTVIGLITGLFTSGETTFYRRQRAELNRRILELATRRAQDQADRLVGMLTEAI